MEMRKISRRHPRSVDGPELGHFTLLFCRGRQRNLQKCYNARAQQLFCLLYNTDCSTISKNVLHNENHEKFQHFALRGRNQSSLTSGCSVKGNIGCGIIGFSSLIQFVKVSFTVDLACSSESCWSHSAESKLDNQSPLSLLFLVYGVLIVEFAPAKLALLAHPNRDS